MIDVISNKSSLKYLSLEFSLCKAGLPRWDSLGNLEHLNLCRNWQVDDNLLMKISECCKTLKHLNLRACPKITDQGITILANLPQLEELVLTQHHRIKGTCLQALHSLKRIRCAWCDGIHDKVIINLLKSSVKLEYLNVAYSGVTSKILDAANEVVKQKKTQLCMSVSDTVKKSWPGVDVSPLLVVRDDEENSLLTIIFA